MNRKSLISKHNPVLNQADVSAPLSVGNGKFAFTADVTGLQTFTEDYAKGMPLCTMAEWGWHTTPVSETRMNYKLENLKPVYYDAYGCNVPYYTGDASNPAYDHLRENPHKYNLAKIGFSFGEHLELYDLKNIHQSLDLYSGILNSGFTVAGTGCEVQTACHPERDCLAIRAENSLLSEGKMNIRIELPYPSPNTEGSDWKRSDAHHSILGRTPQGWQIRHVMDNEQYVIAIHSESEISVSSHSKHCFTIGTEADILELTLEFTPDIVAVPLSAAEVFAASKKNWQDYWENGGMIFLDGSEKARELERRLILSQYLTALQCCGSLPPSETGLTCNSWYGKFHLEMHFWHAVHFVLYNRIERLESSLQWYIDILPQARKLAKSQGYRGARWPKMTYADGIDSPSPIGPLLIWQQPHIILYCDWCYKSHPNRTTLLRYRDLVVDTAEFMTDFAVYDAAGDRYVLGPPLIPAQERHKPQQTINPVFELEYWLYGIRAAIRWLKLLGEEIPQKWLEVEAKLATPVTRNGLYMAHENCSDTFVNYSEDHPSMLAAYGLLDNGRINSQMMSDTLDKVLNCWDFESMWGWDFPVMAMTAAKLGRREEALDLLLYDAPKNAYVVNGHNQQSERKDLPLYLPGNGGVLLAAAFLANADAYPDGVSVNCEGMNFAPLNDN